jgi:hypothetical protein
MNETKRTLIFVAVAVVSVGAASASYYVTRPRPDAESKVLGTEFYPEFQDPTTAQVLRVVAYDDKTASVKEFKVEYKDGKWRIPSHHNYPADAKDRLAQTAASIIGVTRGSLVSRRKSDQARYGVVDPDDSDATVLKGRGQRITLSKNDGTVLADFVIGNKAEGQTDAYYVRAPKAQDADSIYLTKLKIDLSTKFGDWIEPDLLKVDRDQLTDIRIDNYSIDETQGVIVPGQISELKKQPTGDSWELVGIKPDEELKTDTVNQLVNSLDNLRLVGVRPKPQGVHADLTLDPRIAQSRELVAALRNDMLNRGFILARERAGGKTHLYSKEGELEAGTKEGVQYSLHFGQIFTGTEFEIETGLSKDKDKEKAKESDKNATKKEDDKSKESLKKSRYLMVYASFDPKLLGAPPVKPTEPKKPPGVVLDTPADAAKKSESAPATKPAAPKSTKPPADSKEPNLSGDKANKKQSSIDEFDPNELVLVSTDGKPATPAAKSSATDSKVAPKPAAPPAGTKPAEPTKASPTPAEVKKTTAAPAPAVAPKPDPKAQYLKAMDQYKKDLERYENDKSEYEKKLTKGKEKVKELNDRFAPWYYVISAESFENLRLARSSLVKPKGQPADKKDAGNPHSPAFPSFPGK